jgi:hypothetical protein
MSSALSAPHATARRSALALVLAASAAWRLGGRLDAAAAELDAAAASAPALAVSTVVVPGFRRRDWMTDPLEVFRLYSARGLIDPKLTPETLHSGGETALRPLAVRNLDPLSLRALLTAYPLAVQQLRAAPACRALYEALGTDGLLALSTTVYLGPASRGPMCYCDALHASAYTRIGQQTTVICPAFSRQSASRAAVTLLHEALHYAGLPERPGDPTALSSPEISALVSDRCGL